METFSLIMIGLTCLFGLSSVWLLVSLISRNKKNRILHRQLTALEFNLTQTKALLSQSEKKWTKNQEQQNIVQTNHDEFAALKAENTRLNEELKKLSIDLRIKDKELKKLESLHIDKVYLLTNERDALATQIRETKSNISKVISLETKLRFAEQEIEKLTKEVNASRVSPFDPQLS